MEILDRELTAIETGANDRLIVQMPPRHGKSFLTSGYFPAHYMGVHPDRNVIMTSATADLAMEFSGMTRDLLSEHGHLFGVSVRKDRCSLERWELDQGGKCRAAGVGGGIMGRGADLLLIDDYFMNIEAALSETQRKKLYQWYLTTSGTRLSPTGAIVIVATRWHGKDLIGQILDTAAVTGEKWRVVKFPALSSDGAALWPEQWSAEKLEAIRAEKCASGYPWIWDALYQQEPPDVLDAEWPQEYFDDIWCDDWPSERLICVVALDPSLGESEKSDYSAFVAVCKGHDNRYYVDANISRRPSSEMVTHGIEWMEFIKPDAFGCEAVAFQKLLLPQFEAGIEHTKLNMGQVYKINNNRGSQYADQKRTRIRSLTQALAQGRIKIRRSPGSSLLVEQLKGFPSHKFDDGPDALEMAIRLCEELLQGSGYEEPEEVLVA